MKGTYIQSFKAKVYAGTNKGKCCTLYFFRLIRSPMSAQNLVNIAKDVDVRRTNG